MKFEPTPENILIARTACWEALRLMARSTDPSSGRGEDWSMLHRDDGLFALTAKRLGQHGFEIRTNASADNYPPVYGVVRETFMAAVSAGLIVPFPLMSQALNWNAGNGHFQFTAHGLKVLTTHDEPDVFAEGTLRRVLHGLQRSGRPIADGTIALLDEAQRCALAHCYRAAIVLVGLAAEDQALSLCEATSDRVPQPKDAEARAAWENLRQESNFSRQWKGLLALLDALKRAVRKLPESERGTWQNVLEPVPWGIGGGGEAVRMTRNAAAHDADRVFTHAEVVLQIKAIPSQLDALAALEVKLRDPATAMPAL